jgi:hypothetical protein
MDNVTLVDDQYNEGKKLIEALDKQGERYPIVLWINDPEKNDWILLFGIPKLKITGVKKIFTIMHNVLIENHINISLNTITLIDTTNQLCTDLKVMINTRNEIGKISFFGNIINGRRFPDSIIYRVN